MQTASTDPQEHDWNELLAPYRGADDRRAWFELALTSALFVAGWYAMYRSLEVSYLLTLALAPLVGLLQIRLFIFQHDCGHGSFFRKTSTNRLIGSILGVFTLSPYEYWKRTHAIHHAGSGNLEKRGFGDMDTLTVREYRELPEKGKFMYRLLRNPLFFLGVGPIFQFVLKHRYPWDIPDTWTKEWRNVYWTDLGLLGVAGGLCWAIGWKAFLAVAIPVQLVAGPVGMWLFFVQHQYEDAYWRHDEEWSYQRAALEGSSHYDLPAILHWFTGNIGLHHIHHLDSRIPCYKLQACHASLPELPEVKRFGIVESLGCVKTKLWDEDSRQMVDFSAAADA